MSERIYAPWTPGQVQAMQRWQVDLRMHPFTCPNRGDGEHQTTTDLGVLVPTEDGWICRNCEYRQTWAWAFMAKPLPF